LLQVTSAVLSADALAAEAAAAVVASNPEGCGAVTTFVGLVREQHKGRRVTHLVYEAFDELAVRTFEQIQREAADWWPDVVLGIHHRTGRLVVGEASVVIAAASAHRAPSFAVCRYAIERVKQIAPVWKDPSDAHARETARQRACASA
jgi:molybdopterin synthase catalytic subunit